MYTRTFERDNQIVKISDYGFEFYEDGELIRVGLVDGLEATIEILILEGFCEVFDDE